METTWSSVFCSKFNWKSHSCTTKQWKKLAAWKHLQAYVMSILYIKSKKMISPIPKIYAIFNLKEKTQHPKTLFFSKTCDDLWYRKSSPHLTPPPLLHSPDTKEVVTFSCAGKNTWQMNPPQNFANDLNEDSQTPNKILTLHHICVFKNHSNLHKLEKRLKVGWIWDFPHRLQNAQNTTWPHENRVGRKLPGKRTFRFPQSMDRSLVGFWLSVFFAKKPLKVMSNLTSPDAQVCGDMRVMSDVCLEIGLDMISNHPRGGGFTNLMISCHWISNLERNKMCVCGGLVGREGLQYP